MNAYKRKYNVITSNQFIKFCKVEIYVITCNQIIKFCKVSSKLHLQTPGIITNRTKSSSGPSLNALIEPKNTLTSNHDTALNILGRICIVRIWPIHVFNILMLIVYENATWQPNLCSVISNLFHICSCFCARLHEDEPVLTSKRLAFLLRDISPRFQITTNKIVSLEAAGAYRDLSAGYRPTHQQHTNCIQTIGQLKI